MQNCYTRPSQVLVFGGMYICLRIPQRAQVCPASSYEAGHTNTRFSQLCSNHGTIKCRYSIPTWHSTIHIYTPTCPWPISVHACPHLQVEYWQILAHLDDYKIANYKCRETKQPCRGVIYILSLLSQSVNTIIHPFNKDQFSQY